MTEILKRGSYKSKYLSNWKKKKRVRDQAGLPAAKHGYYRQLEQRWVCSFRLKNVVLSCRFLSLQIHMWPHTNLKFEDFTVSLTWGLGHDALWTPLACTPSHLSYLLPMWVSLSRLSDITAQNLINLTHSSKNMQGSTLGSYRDGQEETHTHRNEMRHTWWRTIHLSNVWHIDGKCQSLIQECVLNLIHVIPYYFD